MGVICYTAQPDVSSQLDLGWREGPRNTGIWGMARTVPVVSCCAPCACRLQPLPGSASGTVRGTALGRAGHILAFWRWACLLCYCCRFNMAMFEFLFTK